MASPRFDPEVDALVSERAHPLAGPLQALRALLLPEDDASVVEGVKWNSPSYRLGEQWFATINLQSPKGLRLILHAGARGTVADGFRAALPDPAGLLRWLGEDRAMFELHAGENLQERAAELAALLGHWRASLTPQETTTLASKTAAKKPAPKSTAPAKKAAAKPAAKKAPAKAAKAGAPQLKLQFASVFVADQEKALRFYVDVLGFKKMADIPMGPDFRWLTVISPNGVEGMELALEPMAFAPAKVFQQARFKAGNPAMGMTSLDIDADYAALTARGVKFRSPPQEMGVIRSCMFEDGCGNLIHLVQPT